MSKRSKILQQTSQSTPLNPLFYQEKWEKAKQELIQLTGQHPSVDEDAFQELDRLMTHLERTFIQHRSSKHLASLAKTIFANRQSLLKNIALFPFEDHVDVCLLPTQLYFSFNIQSVIGILIHIQLKDLYEIFNEEKVLLTIQKIFPDIHLIKDSIYEFQPRKNRLKTLYFEVSHPNEEFLTKELTTIKKLLKQEIKLSVEKLVPRLFMVRNEEEVLKNILVLSREIHSVFDVPQVMILFDEQTNTTVIFTVIIVHPDKGLAIQERLLDKWQEVNYELQRSQIVRYLRKKHPIRANIVKIELKKESCFFRLDLSLNFYLIRQKVTNLLNRALGEFRDYNGGLITKQRQSLEALKTSVQSLCLQESDIVEDFYYALYPLEVQMILSLAQLKAFFSLFLEAKQFHFIKPSDVFFKSHQDHFDLFIVIRFSNQKFQEVLNVIVQSLSSYQSIATFSIPSQNTHLCGYFLSNISSQEGEKLSQLIQDLIDKQKAKMNKKDVLRLCFEYPVISLDPRIGGDQNSALVLKMLFEGLMRKNREGKLEKGIAQEITISVDQKTYTFRLKNSFWSDGSAVTAFDFEYAWKKVLSPQFITPYDYLFYPIKNAKQAKQGFIELDSIGVRTIDAYTLEVELEFPASYFLELTAHPIYSPVPQGIDEKNPNWSFEDNTTYLCNGAFKLTKNILKEEHLLTKNPYYWDQDQIYLKEIRILKTSLEEAYQMFHQDLNHWIGPPITVWDPEVISPQNQEALISPNTGVYWIAFNTQLFPFNHKKIRKALAMGIRREELKRRFNLSPAISPIPIRHSQIQKSILSDDNVSQARILFQEALEELKLKKEDFPPIHLIYLFSPIRNKMIQFLKEEWKHTFGIECNDEILDWRVLFNKLNKGDFMVGGIGWESWIDDPIYTIDTFRNNTNSMNFSHWQNDEYENILVKAENESNLEKKYFLYLRVEEILLEEMPLIPFFLLQFSAFKKENLHINYSAPPMDFKWSYFT